MAGLIDWGPTSQSAPPGATPAAPKFSGSRIDWGAAYTQAAARPAPFDINSVKDVPSLNQALRSKQINQNQWMSQFKTIQNKLPGNTPSGPTRFGMQAVKAYGPSVLGRALTNIPKDIAVGTNQGLIQPLQHQVTKQYQYLSGPTSTQQQRTTIAQNQHKAQTASPQTQDLFKQAPAAAKVQAAHLLARGHQESAVQTYLNKQVALGNQQTMRGAGVGLQLASLGVGGGATLGLTKAFARSTALNAAAAGAGSVGNNLTANPNATAKQLAKSGALGVVAGTGLSVGGGLLGKTITKAKGAPEGPLPTEASHVTKASTLPTIIKSGELKTNQAPIKGYEGEKGVYLQSGPKNSYGHPGEDNVRIVFEQSALPKNTVVHGDELTVPNNLSVNPQTVARIETPTPELAKTLQAKGFNAVHNPELASESPNPTKALAGISKKQPMGEAGSVGIPETNDYVKQQIKLQDAARNAGTPGKVREGIAEGKRTLVDSLAPIEDTLHQKVTPQNAASHITPQLDRAIRGEHLGADYIKKIGLDKVIQSAPNAKELSQYLIAKHAPAYEAEHGVGSSGRNLAADQQLVRDLGPKYAGHAAAINEVTHTMLDDAVNYGLISKDTAKGLKTKYPDYIPMNRVFGENELKSFRGTGSGVASISGQSVVKTGKGSQRAIEDPLASLIDKAVRLVQEGERNKAAQTLISYKDLPGNPFQLRELGENEVVGSKPVISVLDGGAQRQFETTPEIAAAAKSLNKEQLGLVGRILFRPATRILRLGATGLNPAFAIKNVAKDTVSAFINSRHSLRASVANPQVFVQALKAAANHGSKEYTELVRQGAGGTSFDIARNAPKQNVRAIRMQRNLPSRVAYTVTNPAQLLRAAENTIGRSEEFNRAIQYFGNKQAALKKGVGMENAQAYGAHSARNNTVNFARAGDWGKVLNSTFPYLNAGVQGSRTLVRNLKQRPVQTAAKLVLTTFFPTAVVTAWNVSDPKRKAAYDDIKQYEKDGNIIIVPPNPVKDKNGKWNVIKIPVSQEIANLNNVVRNGVEAGVKDKSLNLSQMLGNTVGAVTSVNAQSPRALANQFMPQALKPGVESLVNQNLYTGNKIVPDSQRNLPSKDQAGPGTSKTAIKIGQITGLSPRHIDNAISTSTGGLGKNIVHGKSIGNQISGGFKGAQGQSSYDLAATRFNTLKGQLTGLPGYQSLPTSEKAKALNRLQSAVDAALIPKTNPDGSTKPQKLSARQRDIVNKNPNLASYLKAKR